LASCPDGWACAGAHATGGSGGGSGNDGGGGSAWDGGSSSAAISGAAELPDAVEHLSSHAYAQASQLVSAASQFAARAREEIAHAARDDPKV